MHDLRLLTEKDAEEFWAFRLAALEESPQSFAESAEDFRASPVHVTAQRLRESSQDNFVLGAFVAGRLVGTVGFFRSPRQKTKHKGQVWGVYVDPLFRRSGVGRSLMEALVARLSKVEGLEQVMLSVATTQPAAIALYKSIGFQSFGVERKALKIAADYVDEEHQVLMLQDPANPLSR